MSKHTPDDEELKNVEGLQYLEDTFMTAVEDAHGIGYGRMMQLISNKWANLDPVGALTVGSPIGESREVGDLLNRIDRLVAEKAEILEALKALVDNRWRSTILKARAAIAKHEPVEGKE